MNLDPSLAFTAVLELRPNLADRKAREYTAKLADAMTEGNPPDRWTFAKVWLVLADRFGADMVTVDAVATVIAELDDATVGASLAEWAAIRVAAAEVAEGRSAR
jgi:hypothetical protein